jgi:hypothetical protein
VQGWNRSLQIPADHHDPVGYYQDLFERNRPRRLSKSGIGLDDILELKIAAFEEMYPTEEEQAGYLQRKERIVEKLARRMSNRLTPTELSQMGVLPDEYFNGQFAAIEMKVITRRLAEEDLKRGLKNRSNIEELVVRGLTRYEYHNMDMDEAREAIANASNANRGVFCLFC